MREQDNRRSENVRLVRLPNGRLVSEEQAKKSIVSTEQTQQTPTPISPKVVSKASRRERKKAAIRVTKAETASQKGSLSSDDSDILEVWKKQEELKKETERMELEYELTKKMARELKLKLKERNQPYEGEGIDDAFKDLLSPEAKDLAKKIKPKLQKTKHISKNILYSTWLSVKKYIKFFKLAINKYLNSKKLKLATIPFVILLVVGIVVTKPFSHHISVHDVQGASQSNSPSIEKDAKPDFATLYPADKTIEQLGGFTRVSPPDSAPAYAFADAVENIKIKLTQQQLPDALKTSPTGVEDLAKRYNATKLLQVDNTNVYLGKSEKGPQTAIFTKDGLLVFVVAEKELSEIQWVRYVTNLVKR